MAVSAARSKASARGSDRRRHAFAATSTTTIAAVSFENTAATPRARNCTRVSAGVLASYDCAVRTQASTSVAARTSKNPAHHATTSGASGADSVSSPASAAHDRPGAQPATSRAVRYATVPCNTTFNR